MNKSVFSCRDQIFFFKRLSLLLASGIPLSDCFAILKNQASHIKQKELIETLSACICRGHSLSASLGKMNAGIDSLSLCLIRVGEANGILEENLSHIIRELKKREEIRKKLISACAYPCMIIATTIAVTSFIVGYLFPKVIPIVQSLNVPLPWTTRFLLFFFAIVQHHWLLLVLAGCASFIGIALLLRKKIIRTVVDRWILMMPIAGHLVRSYNICLIARSMGLLLAAGTPLIVSIRETATIIRHTHYSYVISELERASISGKRVSTHFASHSFLIPAPVLHMIATGEKTGELASSFLYIAQAYEEDLDERITVMSQLLEPILMIGIGLIVGFIAISIISPMYGITQHIYPQ